MTRLTNPTYFAQHHQLKTEWLSPGGGAFFMLTPKEQWELHTYFEFTRTLSDEELIAHRKSITDRSLPQRAGRAFAKLLLFTNRLEKYQGQAVRRPPIKSRKKGAPYKIRIVSEVNPDIDPKVLAKVLIEAAREDRAS
jgi:hypothetical protein